MGNGQQAGKKYTDALQAMSLGVDADGPLLRKPLNGEIWPGPKPVPKPKNLPNLVAVTEGWLGDFSRKHHAGKITNANTYRWVTKVFAYNLDGYIETAREDFTTDYYDVLSDTHYVPDIVDEAAINVSVDAVQTVTEHRPKCFDYKLR